MTNPNSLLAGSRVIVPSKELFLDQLGETVDAAAAASNSAETALSSKLSAQTAEGGSAAAKVKAETAAASAEAAAASVVAALSGTSLSSANISVASRALLAAASHSSGLPAILTETGREGIFAWSGANHSADVSSDPQQGLFVAPSTDTTGASGAWVRKFAGAKDVRWFGAALDGTTDDHVAIQAWLDSGGILTAAGKSHSTVTPIVRKCVTVNGEAPGDVLSIGAAAASGFIITFPAGTGGLDIQPETPTTDPAGDLTRTQDGAYGSDIRNMSLVGAGTGASATGVYARTYVHLVNVNVFDFQGKGFDLSASAGAGDGNSEHGNMSNSSFTDCGSYDCGSHGLHIRGDDANGMRVSNFTAFSNGGWGILNESLIGNTFIEPNCAGNISGAIKVPGTVACTITLPWIEVGTGSNCEINGNCSVIGIDLSPQNTTGTPSYYAGNSTRVSKLYFENTWTPDALSAESALSYRWNGLYLQGRGSSADVSLVNQTGNVAAFVPANTASWIVNGTSFANIFQSNGVNQSMPGLASGYFGLIPNVTYGAMLGGSGSTGDATLTNSSGTAAAYVVHGTTNFKAVGNLIASPPASATPANNGEMTFELTSNTTLKVKVKGSDGTVRSASLTLA